MTEQQDLSAEIAPLGDHPHSDPGDGRSECQTCGKWVWLVTHSCKGVPVTQAALDRLTACPCGCPRDQHIGEVGCPCGLPDEPPCQPRTPTAGGEG